MSDEAQEYVHENVDDSPPLDSVEQVASTEEEEPAEDGKGEVEEKTVTSKRQTPDGRFSLNDTVEIKGNRQGVIKFIGHVPIKNYRKPILVGLEVQGKTDGNDGSRGGIRYFHCAKGSGVMVPPGMLVRRIQNGSRPPKSHRGGANRVTWPRSASAPARVRDRGGNAKHDRNKGGRATETRKASRGNRVTDAPVEDQMREIFEGLRYWRKKWQEREDKLKHLAMLVDDPRMTREHIVQCLQMYKKPFVQRVQDRYTTRAACAVLAKLCKRSPESFEPHVVFYLKKLMQQFKGNVKNSIEFVEKCCLDILQIIADDGVMLTELAKASQAKAPVIRKHAFKYIGVLLEKHVPESNSDEKEPVIPEFVDVVDTALRTGLHDADAKVRDEACHALYRLSLIDEIRAERLFQKMTKSSQKSYTRNFKNNARLLREESGRRMNRSPRGSPTRGSLRSSRPPRSIKREALKPRDLLWFAVIEEALEKAGNPDWIRIPNRDSYGGDIEVSSLTDDQRRDLARLGPIHTHFNDFLRLNNTENYSTEANICGAIAYNTVGWPKHTLSTSSLLVSRQIDLFVRTDALSEWNGWWDLVFPSQLDLMQHVTEIVSFQYPQITMDRVRELLIEYIIVNRDIDWNTREHALQFIFETLKKRSEEEMYLVTFLTRRLCLCRVDVCGWLMNEAHVGVVHFCGAKLVHFFN